MEALLTLIERYNSHNLSEAIDFDRFNQYAIVHHSSTIEGSTLTEVETRLLIEEDLTPKGKPLEHSLMVRDHYRALQFIIEAERTKTGITPSFIRSINAQVLKSTGKMYHTVFGNLDSSEGIFRKGNVSAGKTYFVNYDKVEPLVTKLATKISAGISRSSALADRVNLSFDAHFDLLTIHPFYDGNGRTARLLMNYIQLLTGLPMAIVFKDDKADYYEALVQTREQEDISIFRRFMTSQYSRLLGEEITKAEAISKPIRKKGNGYSLLF